MLQSHILNDHHHLTKDFGESTYLSKLQKLHRGRRCTKGSCTEHCVTKGKGRWGCLCSHSWGAHIPTGALCAASVPQGFCLVWVEQNRMEAHSDGVTDLLPAEHTLGTGFIICFPGSTGINMHWYKCLLRQVWNLPRYQADRQPEWIVNQKGSPFAQILHSLQIAYSKLWQWQVSFCMPEHVAKSPGKRYQQHILGHNRLFLHQSLEISLSADMTVSFCFKTWTSISSQVLEGGLW